MTDQQPSPIVVEVEGIGELEFPGGTDPSVIQATVTRLVSERRDSSTGGENSPRDATSSALATAGGMAGGFAGGSKASPVGIALAGLGGAAGQGVSEVIESAKDPIRKVESGWDALKQANAPILRMMRAGAEQAGLEGLGRGVSGVLSAGARRLYGGLLKPKDALLAKSPNVVDDLMKDRRLITEGGKRAIAGEMREVGAEKGAILAAADAAGKTVDPQSIVRSLDTVLDDVMESAPFPSKDVKTLAGIEKTFTKNNRTPMTLTRADKLKTALQSRADRGCRQVKTGTRINDTEMKGELALA